MKHINIFISILIVISLLNATPLTVQLSGDSTHEFKIHSNSSVEYQLTLFERLHLRYTQSIIPENQLRQLTGGSVAYSHSFGTHQLALQIGLDGRLAKGVYHQWGLFQYDVSLFERLHIYPQLLSIWESDNFTFTPIGGVSFEITEIVSVATEYTPRFFYTPDNMVINIGTSFRYHVFTTSLYLQRAMQVESKNKYSWGMSFIVEI